MAPRREVGLGAVRQIRRELKQASDERQELDLRIRRLRAAEAALRGAPSPNAKRLSREQLRSHLSQHPGARSLEIADALGMPPGSVRTLLSTMKKCGEAQNEQQRWYLSDGNG
jgi:hypothetical protein